jgi:hypothetical protein
MLNPAKSKLIAYSPNKQVLPPEVECMGSTIEVVLHDKHLGNYIGHLNQSDIVSKITNDFLTRVNMVKHHFKHISIETMYFLFKTYCMPLYGSQLWDLSSKAMNTFLVAWRKSIRYLFNLPRTTHCSLLRYICDDLPIMTQLYNWFINVLMSLSKNNNQLVKTCLELVKEGSRSAVSNSVSSLVDFFKCNRWNVISSKNVKYILVSTDYSIKGSIIRDILNMQYQAKFTNTSFVNNYQMNFILDELCSSWWYLFIFMFVVFNNCIHILACTSVRNKYIYILEVVSFT